MSCQFLRLKATRVGAAIFLALLMVGPLVLVTSELSAQPVNCQWCNESFDSNVHWFGGSLCDTQIGFCVVCSSSTDGGCHSRSLNGLCLIAHSGGHGGGAFLAADYHEQEVPGEGRVELMGDYLLVLNSDGEVVKASRIAPEPGPPNGGGSTVQA